MSGQFVVKSLKADWQVAPAEHEIVNYDESKIRYRKDVLSFIEPLAPKQLKKKIFYSISTNVLCADIKSSKDSVIEAVERDLYLPLEIAITKWSLNECLKPDDECFINTKCWLINPGEPPIGCRCFALDHKYKHKLEFDQHGDLGQNEHISNDLNEIMKELNSFIGPDRVLFSTSLRHVRQDLGSIKWLNSKLDKKCKPIKVYSIEDLYVALMRKLEPDFGCSIGQGFANHRLSCIDSYNPKYLCDCHKAIAQLPDGATNNCGKAVSFLNARTIIDDVFDFTNLFT